MAAVGLAALKFVERAPGRLAWPVDGAIVLADVAFYASFAEKTLAGQVPYRDFPVEYPPAALPFFILPALVSVTRRGYIVAFISEMLAINTVVVALVAQRVARVEGPQQVPRRLGWYTAFLIPLCPLFVGRFDLAPAALAFAAACWWYSGRPVLGGVTSALGTLVKLAPGAVALPGLALDLSGKGRHRLRGALSFVLTLAAGLAVWSLVAGRGVVESLRYHAERGLEVGSLYSGLLAVWASAHGQEIALVYDHASQHLAAPGAQVLARWVLPIQVASLLCVFVRFCQTGLREPMSYAAAATLAVACTGKVLSPQYLLWVLPFVVVLEGQAGRRGRWLFFVACVLTMALCPWGFRALVRLSPVMVAILNLRNACLLVLLGVLLAPASSRDKPVHAGLAAPHSRARIEANKRGSSVL
jgi:hypothetical protein